MAKSKYFAVTFKDETMGRAKRLGSGGELVTNVMFAVMLTKDRAESIAADIREDYPKAKVSVVPF